MLILQLDKLSRGERICICCELIRRLQNVIALDGVKLIESDAELPEET